jgi:hypothetical protein
MKVYDLNGPEGNSFLMMDEITSTDESIKLDDLMGLTRNEIVRKFVEVCGHKYYILHLPDGYK